jgi:hypothetical protein
MRRAIVIFGLLLPMAAHAQNFPPDSAFVPLRCHNGVMTDPAGDVAGCTADCDVVGDGSRPAGLRAADAQFVYLRLRVAGNPQTGAAWNQRAWGFEVDTDGNLSTYEILITVSGISNQVAVYRNSATTIADSPADPADSPPVATFPLTTHARSVAAGSTLGGGADFFVDLAVPWTTLQSLGFGGTTSVRVWAGTSSASDSLNQDIACVSGQGSLSGSVSDPGSFGGTGGTGGTGGVGTGGTGGVIGPVGQNGLEFEGGPSCSCEVGGRGGSSAFLLLVFALIIRRGRRCS